MASSISDEKEPFETLYVQIKFVGVNLDKKTSSGKLLCHSGREFKVSRFGTWVFDELDKQEDVEKLLGDGGTVVALVWGMAKMYPQITVWVTDVESHSFALDLKKSNKTSILDEIGKGKMGQKVERVLKNLTFTDTYKNIKIKLVKILRDSVPAKQKKLEADSTDPIPEVLRLRKLEEAEKIASFMNDQNFSWAFMRLRTLLQSETDDIVRLQLLLRFAICCFHMKNNEELETSIIQMKKLLKTVVIPEHQLLIYKEEFTALVRALIENKSFVRAIEISLSWIEVFKKMDDTGSCLNLISMCFCFACDSLNKLLVSKPGAFSVSQMSQYAKQMEKVIEYIKNMKDCDSFTKSRSVYHTEFLLFTVKAKMERKTPQPFGKETKDINSVTGCWSDFMFVSVRLSEDPRTAKFFTDNDFLQNIREISDHPELLKEKISDPKIAIANEVLLSQKVDPAADQTSKGRDLEELIKTGMFGNAGVRPQPNHSESVSKTLEAQSEKKKGNEAYKKKEFEKAIRHYDKAILLDPTNALFHCNKAAVYIEQKKLGLARTSCLTAISLTHGSDRHSDKDVAKILARLGRTEMLDNKYGEAVGLYEKSLHLHYDPKVKEQLDECKLTLHFLMMSLSMGRHPLSPFF